MWLLSVTETWSLMSESADFVTRTGGYNLSKINLLLKVASHILYLLKKLKIKNIILELYDRNLTGTLKH